MEALALTAETIDAHSAIESNLKVADAVWIATALLHKTYPARNAFSVEEIVTSVLELRLTEGSEKSIRQHVVQHCEALSKPQPNRLRMLYATAPKHRRLFCKDDRYHKDREGSPTHPDWDRLPSKHCDLKVWYENVWPLWPRNIHSEENDPLLALIGTGRGVWGPGDADQYVAELRSNWDDKG